MDDDAVAAMAKELRRAIWCTQGSRLSAYRRMRALHGWSLVSIAAASLYVIGVTLLPHFLALDSGQVRLLGLVATVSAIGILVLSLLEAGQRYELRGERLHNCGLDLGELLGALDIFIAGGCQGGLHELTSLRHKYDSILKEQKENHEPIDYKKFLASRRTEFEIGSIRAICFELLWFVSVYWRFAVLLVLPVAATWGVLNWLPSGS